MRGATPLDVAAASVMDNMELALALREPDLDKVSLFPVYLIILLYTPVVLYDASLFECSCRSHLVSFCSVVCS